MYSINILESLKIKLFPLYIMFYLRILIVTYFQTSNVFTNMFLIKIYSFFLRKFCFYHYKFWLIDQLET